MLIESEKPSACKADAVLLAIKNQKHKIPVMSLVPLASIAQYLHFLLRQMYS